MLLSRILVALATVTVVFGQQYPFLAVPGSPRNPHSLFQDSKGRLWLTGQLTCFDGTRFLSLRDYGFPVVETYDVAEDPSGGIWIGAERGVFRFDGGRIEQVSSGVATSVIAVNRDLALAAESPIGSSSSHNKNLVRIRHEGGVWRTETVLDLHSPGPLTADGAGALLYPGTLSQWDEIRLEDALRWRAGTSVAVRRYGPPGGPPVNGDWRVLRDRDGCFWVGFPDGVSYDCGEGLHQILLATGGLTAAMHALPDGRMLLTGPSVLAIGRPGSFQVATRANGLPGLNDAIMGRDGTIWLAAVDGLYRFPSPFRIEYWTIREGVLDPPWSLTRVGSRMYVGLEGRLATLSHDRGRWNVVANFNGGGTVSSLLPAGNDHLFAGFLNGGTAELRADGAVLARMQVSEAVGARLARTPDGQVWAGGSQFGAVSRRGRVLNFDPHPLLTAPSGNLLAIKYDDRMHRLWACYNGGLILRDDQGVWKEFTTKDGLRVNGCWSLAPVPNGDVWYEYFGYAGTALIHPMPDGRIRVRDYDLRNMPDPGGSTLDLDHSGRLWRSGESGIYVADPAEAEAAHWLQLDRSDGLPANDMNSGSVFVDTDNSLWWGADNDLAHYAPPADLTSPGFAPQVFVSALSWEGHSPTLADTVQGVPHGAHVVAHIGSTQFDRRNALRMRYRISPDEIWRESQSLDLPLGALGSGRHTVEVQGRVFIGPWSPSAKLAFTVLPPVWASSPFLASYSAALLIIAGSGYLLYRRWRFDEMQLLPDLTSWRLGALAQEAHKLTGTVLDSRFSVGGMLARGGFATVMEGYDQLRGERCALKIFRTDVKDKIWMQRGFEQEIAALQKVRHPNVVRINAFGRTPTGAPYLAMEFIEGRSLREILSQGPLTPARTARVVEQLSAALEAIHAEGVCHRDVKPENILLRNERTADEEPVLIDFSIAIIKDADETLHGISRAAGTFDYMAPEQAIGHAQASSDIYSLARVLLEMLTGRQLKELLPGAALDLPQQVAALLDGLSLPLSAASIALISAALEFDPMRRPSSARAFAHVIARDLRSANTKRAF